MSFRQPFGSWTPGSALANYRELQYGTYVFPLTGQEKTRDLKLGQDKKKLPRGMGAYIAVESSPDAREVTVTAAVGSGMMGSAGGTINTQDDLESERALLAGAMAQGRQKLYTRPDRYLLAYLTDFQFNYMADAGAFRYADYTLKFLADDPRYYSDTQSSLNLGPYSDTTTHSTAISHAGNVRAYPVVTITGACTSPSFGIFQGSSGIQVTFSQLTMLAGDTLVVACDPRPEYRDNVAQYTPNGGTAENALRFCLLTDFSNTLNVEEWFPYVEATQYQSAAQTFQCASTQAGNYTVNVTWSDTWL